MDGALEAMGGADKKRKFSGGAGAPGARKRGSEEELGRGRAGMPLPGTLLCMQYDGVWYVVVVPDQEETEEVRRAHAPSAPRSGDRGPRGARRRP